MPQPLLVMIVAALLLAAPAAASANGDDGPTQGSPAPPTHFERFVRSGCSPCVKESFAITTITISPAKLPAISQNAQNAQWRPGQLAFEVARAWELGRAARQSLAVRVNLYVVSGAAFGGGLFPLGSGVVDADDLAPLVDAISAIRKHVMSSWDGVDTVDIDVHAGSFRVGAMRLKGETFAYVQTGDMATLVTRPVWDVVTTLFLPVSELSALKDALTSAAAKIQILRAAEPLPRKD
jgi:hypothetical protein